MAGRNVSDKVDIKYCIPKVTFTKKPSTVQYFNIYVKLFDADEELYILRPWTLYASSVGINPDGTFVYSASLLNIVKDGKLFINNLSEYKEYVIRFVNIFNTAFEYIFKFKTSKAMTLKDSSYYGRVLFPEQNYDLHIAGTDQYDLPNKHSVSWFYPLDSHKYEKRYYDEELYSSCVPGILSATGGDHYELPTNAPYNYLELTDPVTNETAILTELKTKEDNSVLWFPDLRFVEDHYEPHAYYDVEDGGGCIALADVAFRKPLCVVYIDSASQESLRCLYHWDTRLLTSLGTPFDVDTHYCYAYIDQSRHIVCKYYDTTNQQEVTVTSTTTLPANRFFILDIFNHRYKEWIEDQSEELGGYVSEWQNIDIPIAYSYAAQTYTGSSYGTKIPTPFVLGGPNAEKLYVGKFTAIVDSSKDNKIELKLLRPSLFKAIIDLEFHSTDDQTYTYTITNPSPKEESIGFVAPKIMELINKTVDYVNIKIKSQGDVKHLEVLNGLTVGRTHVNAYTFAENYIYDDFDVNFAALETMEEKTTALKETFFTKHGTWGGYNGGVNGHNCYFNHNGVLVLENHGDKYKGDVKAVGKEGLQTLDDYTGYGGDLYTNYGWDSRTNKQCLRVGTTLVSNKYFTFGKVDVWMKLPKGIYGVCPAIWFFHYIEVPEGDPRYDQYPYNQRVQQGSQDDGFYRVVNNEIDIELPSHLTKGSADSFSDLAHCYFDPIAMDDKMMIGIGKPSDNEDILNTGLFRLKTPSNPYDRSSWEQVPGYAGWYPLNYQPSFQNCKFNNWQGEYNSGDGWGHPATYEDEYYQEHTVSAEDYYKGTDNDGPNPLLNEKEEYLAIFQHLSDDPDGIADNRFHKWTIEWLPDRTVLYVDDECIRVNKGFVPFNVMKLTIGTWFPTMPLGMIVGNKVKKCNTQQYEQAQGVIDQNGIYGTKKALINPINDQKPIGTWAGPPADWEVCQVEISRVKYTKYSRNDSIQTYDNDQNGARIPDTVVVNTDPTYYGESYPESGLRWFDTQ